MMATAAQHEHATRAVSLVSNDRSLSLVSNDGFLSLFVVVVIFKIFSVVCGFWVNYGMWGTK